MDWEECVPFLRKEKWSICSGKHYCSAFPAVAQVSFGRKGRVPEENWGKCFTQRQTRMCQTGILWQPITLKGFMQSFSTTKQTVGSILWPAIYRVDAIPKNRFAKSNHFHLQTTTKLTKTTRVWRPKWAKEWVKAGPSTQQDPELPKIIN